jgi:glucosamine--fructose-6-phosphate aminotransferase (isomerizing)
LSEPGTGHGAHSLREILAQPRCWEACLKELPRLIDEQQVQSTFGKAREWLFVGCGSSYYVALAAAASWSAITGLRARAVPASELLLFPDMALAGSSDLAGVVISRSGCTSEALRAAEILERDRNVRTLGVSCTPGERLEKICTRTLVLGAVDEKSTVMTQSFTSMLLALQYSAASLAGDHACLEALGKVPASAEPVLTALNRRVRDFTASHRFADYIALGQGPFYGLACECSLKLSEMSVSYGQSFHTLEFRHGPKSVVSAETLIMFLISETGYAAECDVLEEVKGLGGTTLTLVNRADSRMRASSDLLVEFDFEIPELARLAAYVFAGQLVGLYTGLGKGLDPDNPRNLSRVVVLNEPTSGGKSEHATL